MSDISNLITEFNRNFEQETLNRKLSMMNEMCTQNTILQKQINELINSGSFNNSINSLYKDQNSLIEKFNNCLKPGIQTNIGIPQSISELNNFIFDKNQIQNVVNNCNISCGLSGVYKNLTPCNTSLDFLKSINKNYFQYEDVYPNIYKNLESTIPIGNIEINKNKVMISTDIPKSDIDLCNQKDLTELPILFPDIQEKDAISFISLLKTYPMLALLDSVGKKIYNGLKQIIKKSKKTLKKGSTLYRSRIWENEQEIEYSKSQMWGPPIGKAKMQRYNLDGGTCLYMADTKETALAEVGKKSKYTIMKADVRRTLNYIDLSENDCLIFQLCNKKRVDTDCNPNEYLLPNFIAQCLSYMKEYENIDIDGIRYKSVKDKTGTCYVFFNTYKDSFMNDELID